jgi:hypothetical protein
MDTDQQPDALGYIMFPADDFTDFKLISGHF